jgi:hypothetical protein
VGLAGIALFRMLSRTMRYEGVEEQPGTDPRRPDACGSIVSVWHDELLVPLTWQSLRPSDIVALVSRHQDGAYLAEFMKRMHVRSVRGSTARGGEEAVLELLRQPPHCHIFITPDGPRGPRHTMKRGIVYLASRTGRPILPLAALPSKYWHINGSWTGMYVPKPFACCHYVLGKPLYVPPQANKSEIEQYRAMLQSEMDRVHARLADMMAKAAVPSQNLPKAA